MTVSTSESIWRGSTIVEGVAEADAMVTDENLAFSLIDPKTGVVTQPQHAWTGLCVAGKILIFPSGKGSSSGSYWLLNLASEGNAPAAIVNAQTDAVIVAGAVLGDVPLIHRLAPDPFTTIRTGERIHIDATAAEAIVTRLHNDVPPR